MSIEMLVRHCAPTLAGMKIGNLVAYTTTDRKELDLIIKQRNAQFNHKGVYFTVLKWQKGRTLVYVYRKKQLLQTLQSPEIQVFLQSKGYHDFKLEHALSVLRAHLIDKDFPHEIGVFLGYPLEDIKAFIEHKGANYKCVGCWKSYTDEQEAKKIFAKYSKCTRVYCEQLAQGCDIARLVVAV